MLGVVALEESDLRLRTNPRVVESNHVLRLIDSQVAAHVQVLLLGVHQRVLLAVTHHALRPLAAAS